MEKQKLISIINILQSGKINLVGQVIHGSNFTLLTDISAELHSIQAIYKPDQGERPLWDFPPFTLAKREVAAFVVSSLLNWHFVPPTVYRKDAPYGSGSLQLFIPHDSQKNFFNFSSISEDVFQKIVIFDFIINNADRKGGHLIQDENENLWLIDHGLSFNRVYKLRTVIWNFAGEPIPKNLINDIKLFEKKIQSQSNKLLIKLNKLLTKEELEAMAYRTQFLIESELFPKPEEERRSYPWPLI